MDSRPIIYTSITNGYDEIPNEHYYDPDIRYVCFTDGTVEHKGPWEFRDIPIKHECPRRLSAYAKINPHKLFPVGSKVAWIDGCYVMTKRYCEEVKKYLSKYPFTIVRHYNKFTYYDEILEGFMGNMNTWDDQIEITKALADTGYNFRLYDSPVLGTLFRVITEDLFDFHDMWWKYSLIGPNRDQLSFDCARQYHKLKYHVIEDGWLGEKSNIPGSLGILFGSKGKQYRKKLHPQAGNLQGLNMDEIKNKGFDLVYRLYHYTNLHPKMYTRYDQSAWILFNVLDPSLPKS